MKEPLSVWKAKVHLTVLLVAATLLTGCGKKAEAPAKAAKAKDAKENPLNAPANYVGAVVQAQKTAVKVTDLASVSQAIQMFYHSEDRYPQSLNELVTMQYLPRLPALPSGMRFEYNPANGQVRAVRK